MTNRLPARCRASVRLSLALLCFCGAWAPASPAAAQGLIWNLPPDGTWVRYEGSYEEVIHSGDPMAAKPQTTVTWLRKMEIKSVGREDAEYAGQTVPCRWIEIKTVTGTANPDFPLGIDPGETGVRIIKALVPESRVLGRTEDETGIPVSFLPIVRGYQKVGPGPVVPLGAGVLQVYPSFTLLQHYPTMEAQSGQPEDPQIRYSAGAIRAIKHTAAHTTEGPASRTINQAEVWISSDVPFGLAKWDVRVQRFAKEAGQPRGQFRLASEIRERMEARETGRDAANEAPSEITAP